MWALVLILAAPRKEGHSKPERVDWGLGLLPGQVPCTELWSLQLALRGGQDASPHPTAKTPMGESR